MNEHAAASTIIYDQDSYDEHAKAWESSGLSQNKYCALHRLKYWWFVAARSRLVNSGANKPKEFVPIVPLAPKSEISRTSEAAKIILKFAKGSTCELPIDLTLEQMQLIFTALGAVL